MLLATSLLLSGCSSSDAILAEKLAAADAAAVRAEKAADRAEKAAGKLYKQPAAVVHMEPEPSDLQDPSQTEPDQQQAASAPTNHG
jgi:hypothetical protein